MADHSKKIFIDKAGRDGQTGVVYASDLMAALDGDQTKAVTHIGSPSLVLAGAGSGKTRVITYRIAYLINVLNMPPSRILAVTFTNKAANEMKERLTSMKLSEPGKKGKLWVHTFHRTCSRILRTEGASIGLGSNFTVADYQDQLSIIRKRIQANGTAPGGGSPDSWLWKIGRLKDNLIRPKDIDPADEEEKYLADLYAAYQNSLQRDNLLDFDDLLLETEKLFREDPGVLEKYRERFPHILVDEFQDTNQVQYLIMKMLTGEGHGLFVVGDEDQSIYRWRGAAAENFQSFRKDFPGAKVFFLEKNYRSTPVILKAAGGLIEKSIGRTPKKLRADRKGGSKIVYHEARDMDDEAKNVVRRIKGLSVSRYTFDQVAVLYRVNAQSVPLERALSAAGIAYRLVGGTRLFVRQEVKDTLAYVRLALNPDDDPSFRRVVNTPARGIGPTTMESVEKTATEAGISLFSAAGKLVEEGTSAGKKVKRFLEIVDHLCIAQKDMGPSDLFIEALRASGYEEWLASGRLKDSEARIANLKEVEKLFGDLSPAPEGERSLAAFLDEVALLTDADEGGGGGVTLMTIHSAKGLEFPVIFLVGMEEGLLPHRRALTDTEELEEERRLCYVGMTRAKDMLFLSNARQRTIYGRTIWNTPSRFLDDIPPSALQSERTASTGLRRISEKRGDNYPIGYRAKHPVFGVGIILGREGSGDNLKLTVSFPGRGTKKILARLAGFLPLKG